jgi:hypothetical protein
MLRFVFVFMVLAGPVWADMIRLATYAAPLSRDGPGLLLRDLGRGDDPQIAAIVAVATQADADVLVLTDFDYDLDGLALAAFAALVDPPYPYHFALRPNAGLQSGFDLDGNGRIGDPRDAVGYGRFAGDGGLAILSRWPIDTAAVTDLSGLIWRDLPDAVLPMVDGQMFWPDPVLDILRLSSTGHWIVPVQPPDGATVTLLAFGATPPVFDGPEDANGLRNRDELRLWQWVLDGDFGPPPDDFVVIGNANLDPAAGQGLRAAMTEFLAHPLIQDPLPDRPTADWTDQGIGMLRVSYVLPQRGLQVVGADVIWTEAATLAGPHHLVWVDIMR